MTNDPKVIEYSSDRLKKKRKVISSHCISYNAKKSQHARDDDEDEDYEEVEDDSFSDEDYK